MEANLRWIEAAQLDEVVDYVGGLGKPSVPTLLNAARESGRMLIQPRCGVGDHGQMMRLLQELETAANPDVLTLTIDSYTRLCLFDQAEEAARNRPEALNGYPLVAHGCAKGRELNESVRSPIQVRHGSPDGRQLFAVSLLAGITAFEGGGISYNVPYCKKVPIRSSLEAWREIDRACGAAARGGLVIDRELFGTLTAVLVPPSLALAIVTLEAMLAAKEGVTCVSMAISQTGNFIQDIAALRSIPILAERFVPRATAVYSVFHEFMGAFPKERHEAEALIFYGALTARFGGACKLINKTYQEAIGIPDVLANAAGIHAARMSTSGIFDFLEPEPGAIQEEMEIILAETTDILTPVLQNGDVFEGIVEAFARGYLDVPFSPNIHVKSEILPMRDSAGAIRYYEAAGLQLRPELRRLNRTRVETARNGAGCGTFERLLEDIEYFSRSRPRGRLGATSGEPCGADPTQD